MKQSTKHYFIPDALQAAPAAAAEGPAIETAVAPRRPPGRPRKFDREAALESAMLVFWENGYEATSVADLTAAMGINAPSLYATFGDKEKLFLEAIDRYVSQYGTIRTRALREEPTARAGVERWLTEAVHELTCPGHPRGCMVEMAANRCSAEAEQVRRSLRQRRANLAAQVGRHLQAAVDAGELPADTNAGGLGHFYALVYQGMSGHARDGATRELLLEIVRTAMRAWPAG